MKNNMILQITDTHLFEDKGKEMFGLCPNQKLEALVDYLLVADISFDRIFLTGDVSQDMSVSSYEYAVMQLSRFKKPVHWIPGNHDSYLTMLSVFNNSEYFQLNSYLKTPNCSFIFLNTQHEGFDSGYFHSADQKLIENRLNLSSRDEKFCIVMHHHPIKTGTELIDHYILENTEEFWNVLDRYPNINHVICGHVHGDYTLYRKNVTVHMAMASCLQFKKGMDKMIVENISGCKLYKFTHDSVFSETISLEECNA